MSRPRSALFLIALLLSAAAEPAAAIHVPPTPENVLELEGSSRIFLDLGDFDPVLDLTGRFEGRDFAFRYRALSLGGYYRLHRNVKAGLFYRLQAGARHDDDWVLLDNGDWEWQDTRSRLEQVLVADLTPRFLLPFLPGQDWVLAVKGRYLFNTFNRHQVLLLRPQLSYFWLRRRQPLLTVSAAYGIYGALNFSDQFLYRKVPYLDVLYHLADAVKLSLGVSRRQLHWSSSADIARSGESDYSVDQSSWMMRSAVILQLDL